MQVKNCLVIGADGLIGQFLIKDLKNLGYSIYGTSRRLEQINKFSNLIYFDLNQGLLPNLNIELDFVIFSAGITSLDYCEKNIEISNEINIKKTIEIISYFLSKNIRVLFLSSNEVFDGAKSFCKYSDQTNPRTVYGIQKRKVEETCADSLFFSLRLTKVFTEEMQFLKKWRADVVLGKKIYAYKNEFFSPITLSDVAGGIVKILKISETQLLPTRNIYHLGNKIEISYFDFAKIYFRDNIKALSLLEPVYNFPSYRNNYNSLETHLPE